MPSETYEERRSRQFKERQAAFKRKRRGDNVRKAGKYAAYTVGAIVAITACVAVGALVFKALVWNLGLVGLAAAVGLTVSKISFATAFGALFLLSSLRSLLHGATGAQQVVQNVNARRS